MESRRATLAGVSLARAWQAPATLLHVETRPRGYSERVVGSAAGIELLRETGAPAERILSAAGEKNAALIVLGSRGSSAMRTLVTGSVSARVAHESPVSVLIVKAVKP